MDHSLTSNNTNPGIKELSSSLYKSRNNLVDFTGFNLLKRDGMSLTKNKNDLKINDAKRAEITVTSKKQQSEADKKVSKPKEFTATQVSSKKSVNNIKSNETNQSIPNTKDSMEKYFKQLWERNVDKKVVKTKETSKHETTERIQSPKRNKPNAKAKNLALPSQSKIKHKKDNSDAKRSETKSKSSKKDTENKSKTKTVSKSKSETKPSILVKTTTSSISPPHNNKPQLNSSSSKDIKRKDFKLDPKRQNDSQPNSAKKVEQKSIKSKKTNSEKKTSSSRKPIVQPKATNEEKKDISTKEKASNVSTITCISNNNTLPNKNKDEKQDLPKIGRKRTKSEVYKEQDNMSITVEQGVKVSSTTMAKYEAPVKKSKPKKRKRIKLVINIECPSSGDSDSEGGIEYTRRSPDDCSFLDDFDVDEIVECLDSCREPFEYKKVMPPIIEDTKTNNMLTNIQVVQPKEKLINDFNIKVKSDIKEEVIVIVSDSENDDSEPGKGFKATQNCCVKPMEVDSNQNIKVGIPFQEQSNIVHNPKETDIKNSAKDIINIINYNALKFKVNTDNNEAIFSKSGDIKETSLKAGLNSTEDNEDIQIDANPSNLDEYTVKCDTVEPHKGISDINQQVETKNDTVPASVGNNDQSPIKFTTTQDRGDIQIDVKPVIDEHIVKEVVSLQNQAHKTFTDVNQNEIITSISPEITYKANEVDISAYNIFSKNTLSMDDSNAKEEATDLAEENVEINIENTIINNNSLPISKQERNENTEICNDILEQPTKTCDNISKQSDTVLEPDLRDCLSKTEDKSETNLPTIEINQKIKDLAKLNKSGKNVCEGNTNIQKDITNHNSINTLAQTNESTVKVKTNSNSENSSDLIEQNEKTAPKPNKAETEKPQPQNVKGKPNAKNQNNSTSNLQQADTNNKGTTTNECLKNKTEENTNFKTIVVPGKSAVETANNRIVPKPHNKKQSDNLSDGNSQQNQDMNIKSMTSKQFMAHLETRMFQCFHFKFKITSIIHNGSFSVIYKCKDDQDEVFAVKVLKDYVRRGRAISKMLNKIQNYVSIDGTTILYMINNFKMGDNWCFMTEHYTRNLAQALREKKRTLHIDVVQRLGLQLVSAVEMLANNNIIHSDIKPAHILVNGECSKLKLCGFDSMSYGDQIRILPNTGTVPYRAPEIILGYFADHRIDVWSTGLVMYEMATSNKLFKGSSNNEILYKQICTLGSFESDMINASRFSYKHFSGTSFIQHCWKNGKISHSKLIHSIHSNKNFHGEIFMAYKQNWERFRNKWQVTEDLAKIENFYELLKKMLTLDPRRRLPIQFIGASEFFYGLN
ncbi:probable serine/threonine-protein kinase dyrk2 isoform X2 [Trichoplusia ni]|nr:probable serine/threonine-protein kinase dyrk2 isoform X2 [Trichoplusia ni]XP_026734241.1 probable serine/threonine-protein kinase dyrk2 isoform X2 [Trichoplusia ni]XP_026734242.1 probable serine/threonine-protein kinase dyrk2 isoform X2 [Trichoplusia ni]